MDRFCLAHISDVHLALNPRWRQFRWKRLTGRVNWLLNRWWKHKFARFEATLKLLLDDPPDAVILTGDVGQLGLPQEFERAGSLLGPLVDRGVPVHLVSGNHDHYGDDALSRQAFLALRAELSPEDHAPGSRLLSLGPVDLLLLEQGQPGRLFHSGGDMDEDDLIRIGHVLQQAPPARLRIAAGHYPFVNRLGLSIPPQAGLARPERVRSLLEQHDFTHYLCGHIHHRFHREIFAGCTQYVAGSATIERSVRYFVCSEDGIEVREQWHG